MLTTTIALLTATTFAVTVLHVKSMAQKPQIAVSELWKIRAYQEEDARKSAACDELATKSKQQRA